MAFPLEKILNIPIETYCKIQNTDACDYEVVGVHAVADKDKWIINVFAKEVPEDTEVVTNYTVTLTSGAADFGYCARQYASGIALKPKAKN